jgi:protein-S-isoprenylcysteine O-methyltransferase Ste14
MSPARIATLSVASLTWVAFGACMRYYFRRSRQRSPAKDWLVRCALACTAAQMAVLVWAGSPGLALAGAGLACYLAAHGLFWWALATHGHSRPDFAFVGTTPPRFTTAGPYRRLRHPIYSAYLLAWLAGAFAAGQPWLLLTVALMAVLYHRAASAEEAGFLAGPCAAEYQRYRRRTGMFLPRLVPGQA